MMNMQLHQNRRLLLLVGLFTAATAHNITSLLSKHPELATFNHYLTLTHLDAEINDRTTITVLAVDNAAMDTLLSTLHRPTINTLKNILSIHILLDYFGLKKLHQISDGSAVAATVFQATGAAPGTSGIVNITDLQGGKVGFRPQQQDNNPTLVYAYLVKSVEELPYNISVLQISKILPSPVAAAPAPGPGDVNLTSLMSAHGCKEFADALSAAPDALKTFQDRIVGGLTAFCPTDGAFRQFLPKYKKLLSAANKVSFLEFYGIPIYMSMPMLRSNNGLTNTLATDGATKFAFTIQNVDAGQGITLNTDINTVKVSSTAAFDDLPLAVYALDGVLLPSDLFTPAPAPAPLKPADSPKHNSSDDSAPATTSPSESPADSPAGDDVADQTASNARVVGGGAAVLMSSLLLGLLGALTSQPF